MEEGGAGEADHGRQEEAEQHGLVDGGQLVDFDVFKEEGDVVSVDVDPETEDQEEGEPEKVCPYVPRLGVHAEHAQETAQERVHLRTVLVGQILVVLHPVRKLTERLRLPFAVDGKAILSLPRVVHVRGASGTGGAFLSSAIRSSGHHLSSLYPGLERSVRRWFMVCHG